MDRLLNKRGGKSHLLLGNEAIVRGALEAGLAFATCYPGTPSSEVPDTLYRLKKLNPENTSYYFEYSANEKVALECAAGAAVSGLRTLCTMKHVGLNVAADPLMTLAYTGVRAGMVILTADDPSMFSSQNEQDNRYYARLSGLPMLEPSGPAQAKEMTKQAFELSEELGVPVLLRTTTRVNHAREAVPFESCKKPKTQTKFEKAPFDLVVVPAVARKKHLELLAVYDKAQAVSEKSGFNTISGKGKLGVITAGVASSYVGDAIADLQLKQMVKVLTMGFSWPLPEKKLIRFLKGVDKVLIVEELEPLMETTVKALCHDKGIDIKVVGKSGKHPKVPVDLAAPTEFTRAYEYNPRLVRDQLAKFAGIKYKAKKPVKTDDLPSLPGRPPNLCAGCPHRATYYAVKEVLGQDAVYPTDIGCYTLGLLPPFSIADFLVCMGSSASGAGGIALSTGQKVVSFIGDSTFFHSGLTGLVNAVHNNHNFTLVILDNGTTAMTGHQPHPGVDTEAIGDPTNHVDIEMVVRGLGVKSVHKVKPLKTKSTIAAVKEAVEYEGVSVIISQELCPLYAKRVAPINKKPFQVNQSKCKKHLDCLNKVACPAMFKDGDEIRINEVMCIGCALCAQACPENAIQPVKAKQA
jgi:indolepyruvate ferredoxin oxidoreductase alpha subunit